LYSPKHRLLVSNSRIIAERLTVGNTVGIACAMEHRWDAGSRRRERPLVFCCRSFPNSIDYQEQPVYNRPAQVILWSGAMSAEGLTLARDLSLVLLVMEAAVVAVPLVILPFYAIKYVRRLKAPIKPRLRQVRSGVERAERLSKLASAVAVQPVFWTWAATEGLKRGLSYLAKRR